MIYRQGDVVIRRVKEIPKDIEEKKDGILAEGEATGHAHRIVNPSAAKLFITPLGLIFIRVTKPTEIQHEEHESIILPKGDWMVNTQREYDWFNEEIRKVAD